MKTHHYKVEGKYPTPTCGRVPDSIANRTTDWAEVTCRWCLKKRVPEFDAVEQARLLLEAVKNPIPLQMTQLFGISWEAAPEGFDCPRCKGALERTRGLMIASPWAGSVRCTKCDYRDSVTGYLGRSMIQVEPMPPGATPLYLTEPDGDGSEPDGDGSEP